MYFSSDQVESTVSAADIVNSCAAMISDLNAAGVGQCSEFCCDFYGGDCLRYPSACNGNCG